MTPRTRTVATMLLPLALLLAASLAGCLAAGAGDAGGASRPGAAMPVGSFGPDGVPVLAPENDAITWQGARFLAGAALDPLLCTPLSCDEFRFILDVPDGFWGPGQGLEVSIRWESEQNDFDLYLYGPDGALAASSAAPFSTAEGVLVPAALSGEYVVRVVAAGVIDAAYEGLAELELPLPRTGALLPNLVNLPPSDLRIEMPVFWTLGLSLPALVPASCYADETIETGALRCLRFTTRAANLGAGPLEVRFLADGLLEGLVDSGAQRLVQRVYHADGSHEDHPAATYSFHLTHGHVHMDGFAQNHLYEVTPQGEQLVRTGTKAGFCIIDVDLALWNEPGNGPRTYTFPACSLPTEEDDAGNWMVQGISAGWVDVYTWDLPGQYVDVTGLADGCYRLESVLDVDGVFLQASSDDDAASVTFLLAGSEVEEGGC